MASQYDEAVAALYQAPHGEFVNERKRLAGELKLAGDKAGAGRLAKLARPPTSAWTVNQLWWQARDAFDALFESAEKLRGGDLSANSEHRDAIAKLRQHAQKILADAGHGATESTLRRVTTTLAALAASGGFAPDPEGALSADRDPPGFEAVGISAPELVERHTKKEAPKPENKPAAPANDNDQDDDGASSRKEAADAKRRAEAEDKRQLAEAAAERRKKEQAEAKRLAELRGVESGISSAKSEVERKQKELDRLKKAVDQAQAAVDKSQAIVDELEGKLAELVRVNEEAAVED
jgi:hypothetical protein